MCTVEIGVKKSQKIKKWFKLVNPAYFYNFNRFQQVPKRILKQSHDSHTNIISPTTLPFLAMYSPTSQTLAELYNFSFSR